MPVIGENAPQCHSGSNSELTPSVIAYLLFLFTLISLLLFSSVTLSSIINSEVQPSTHFNQPSPDSVLNLQISQTRNTPLKGPWELYLNHWVTPTANKNSQPKQPDARVMLPFFWDDLTPPQLIETQPSNFSPLPASPLGFASYRLEFHYQHPKQGKSLSFRTPKHFSAMAAHLNGHLLIQTGIPGQTPNQELPSTGILHVEIPNHFWRDDGQQELILNMSNFLYVKGGIQTVPELGYSEVMYRQVFRRIIRDLTLNGCIVAMSVYHIALFIAWRRRNFVSLYLGITCLLSSCINILLQQDILGFIFGTIHGNIIWYAFFAFWYLAALSMIAFLKVILSPYFSRIAFLLFMGIFALSLISLIIMPLYTHIGLVNIQRFTNIILFIYSLCIAIKAWKHQLPGSIIFIFTTSCYLLITCHDILIAMLDLPWTYLSGYGMAIFVIGQAVVISKQFSENTKKIEEYSAKVTVLNNNLETQVKERTSQLEDALQEASKMNEKLKTFSEKDGLTDTFNRRFFDHQLEVQWQQCQALETELSLILLDIDHFKRFNDDHGHLCGDACLVAVSSLIKQHLSRSSDFVARYGGEEFAILMVCPLEKAHELAETIRQGIEKMPFSYEGTQLSITASSGVSSIKPLRSANTEAKDLIHIADQRLYAAKRQGRNQVIWQEDK